MELREWQKFAVEQQKNGVKVCSVDFDDTLQFVSGDDSSPYSSSSPKPNISMIEKVREMKKNGYKIFIVSSRKNSTANKAEIENFIARFQLPVDGVYLTDGNFKIWTLEALGVQVHFDDDDAEIRAIGDFAPQIKVIKV